MAGLQDSVNHGSGNFSGHQYILRWNSAWNTIGAIRITTADGTVYNYSSSADPSYEVTCNGVTWRCITLRDGDKIEISATTPGGWNNPDAAKWHVTFSHVMFTWNCTNSVCDVTTKNWATSLESSGGIMEQVWGYVCFRVYKEFTPSQGSHSVSQLTEANSNVLP